jgi:hypothetical protein
MEHHPLWHEEAGVPSLRAFLEILLGNGPEYDSDDINCYTPSCMCYHINGEDPPEEAPELTSQDQSPRCCMNYVYEKVAHL